jgi:hypothetical protein
MHEHKLPALPGTAADGTWRIHTDLDESDGRLAIFAIVKRPPSSPLTLNGTGEGDLIGTGFFLVPNGGFATARHVALEALDVMSTSQNSVGLVYSLSNGLPVFRPVWRFFLHQSADLAFGIPHEIIDDKTGKAFRAKVLSLERGPPAVKASISTWAYPLHCQSSNWDGSNILRLQPAFYDGTVQEIYIDRGPSSKLQPPYYQTDIHLYGGSSGGPVFNETGRVFGVASCSYDGATDFSFVTPVDGIFDIELQDTDLQDGRGVRNVTVAEIANRGIISFR